MKAKDLIEQLEKINPGSTLDFLNENQEFINKTTDVCLKWEYCGVTGG
jgi:hypothetical protein